MKKTIIILYSLFAVMIAFAQQARKEFAKDKSLSGSNYVAYPTPTTVLTPAPNGYTPFYISHYGRHGSRYLIGNKNYDQPYRTLWRADSLSKLTPKGKQLLQKIRLIREEARNRDGELTALGAEQHKQIARRMYENFPQVFTGKAYIDAKSTVVIRCILSMENALQQLLVLNPQLHISHDASQHDMFYMNLADKVLQERKMPDSIKTIFEDFRKQHEQYDRMMREIFNDEDYWREQVNASELNNALYELASNMQSMDLRNSISLYDLFNDDELYANWQIHNAWWYINYGACPLNGGTQPFSQRNLLRNIIQQADSCIALEHPGATLRYGHDTMVLPLACLLGLNGYDRQIEDLEQLDDEDWCSNKVIPMAGNIQIVFYRKNLHDKDILIKVLLNENEATLPIQSTIPPYYHWKDFKDFYLRKLNSYQESIQY